MALELAMQTLGDFRHAVDMLIEVDDAASFRVLCIAAASLNRSIGYALQKDSDKRISKKSKELYNEWRADPDSIFNTFITKYRNHVIHDTVLDLEFGIPLVVQNPVTGEAYLVEDDFLYVPFSEFGFEDLDVRDLFEQSYEWWCAQIERIREEA